jgi:hypothetical protein
LARFDDRVISAALGLALAPGRRDGESRLIPSPIHTPRENAVEKFFEAA